jgi:prepilin-type N-terminal cleavage/methylation domain-containing protein
MNTLLRQARAGFTLLEVLVSTAIMVIIVLTVVTIASDTLRVYDRAVADLSTQSEARGALDAMENDFSTAMIRADGRCWMEIVVPDKKPIDGAPDGVPGKVGNLQPIDHPIVMLFGAPPDRPRWTPGVGRSALRGDVCAIAYRIGQRSPFDAPGDMIQQVYGVYRTIIDSENTFDAALPLILNSNIDAPKSPWDYWSKSQRFANYSKLPNPDYETRALIDSSIDSKTPCWTMDENNFIASNVVAMNLVFWSSSSLSAAPTVAPALRDPCARMPQTLRPVVLVGEKDDKSAMEASKGGYLAMFKSTEGSDDIATAPLRYAPNAAPVVPNPLPNGSGKKVQPYDYYSSRLRVYADRMYPDDLPLKPTATTWLPYLPYSLKAVEVSITVLTPEGSKELRGLQMLNNNQKVPDADFKRIVYMHGRNYTRYIRVLSNGG